MGQYGGGHVSSHIKTQCRGKEAAIDLQRKPLETVESCQNEAPAALRWKPFVEEREEREKAGGSERGNETETG